LTLDKEKGITLLNLQNLGRTNCEGGSPKKGSGRTGKIQTGRFWGEKEATLPILTRGNEFALGPKRKKKAVDRQIKVGYSSEHLEENKIPFTSLIPRIGILEFYLDARGNNGSEERGEESTL